MRAGNVLLAEHAKGYSKLGWALVQLDGKMPLGHGWQRTLPLDPESAWEIWHSRSGNMGIVLGPSGVVDYEHDAGPLEDFLALVGGEIPETPAYRSGKGGLHILFRDPGGLTRVTRNGLDFRAGPHQSALPPSIHPDTGRPYEWINHPSDYPLMDIPQALLDFALEKTTTHGGEAHWREALRGGKLGEGEGRYSSLLSYIGKAVNEYESLEQLCAAAIAFSYVAHDPPYPDDVIEKHATDLWNKWREAPAEAAAEALKLVTADKIVMRSVEFLWRPFLQRSAFHLLVGRKGAGKGSVLAWMAAQVTREADWGEPRTVLWIATEDSFEIDVKPRFVAQGGDERALLCVQQRVHLPGDLVALEAVCREWNVGMLVLDPIVGAVGGIDSNSEGPIVAAIGGLNHLADDLDLAVIGVRHVGKRVEAGMLEAVLGNVAWVNTPRAVLGIAQEEETKTVTMEILAGNRVRGNASYDFLLKEARVQGVDEPVSLIVPSGDSRTKIEDVLAKRRESKVPAIRDWIEEMLEITPEGVIQDELVDPCLEKFGVGRRTLQRACTELKEEGLLRYIPNEIDPLTGRKKEGSKWRIVKATPEDL